MELEAESSIAYTYTSTVSNTFFGPLMPHKHSVIYTLSGPLMPHKHSIIYILSEPLMPHKHRIIHTCVTVNAT